MPELKLVAARHQMRNLKAPVGIGLREIRCFKNDNHSVHLWMNVAEDVRNAWLREYHLPRCTALIESEIKWPSVVDREDIVKERIAVGKLGHLCGIGKHRSPIN